MIPLKLQLKNFLSYGSKLQTIDFGSYPLICLSGKNGHGKSALLDAMTWALWGQARKTTGTIKPDAQLLRLGQTAMMVIFDFAFNGQTYRVRREFALTRSNNPYAVLEFGILEPETETIKPLTDKTIRGTQKKIETLLSLDFDTFTNSAFLRQGHANEFSKKSPKERKEILASILQLDQYEVIKKAAQEKTKKAQIEIHHLDKLQERITSELAQKDELQQKKQELTDKLNQITTNEKTLTQTTAILEQEKQKLIEQEQKQSLLLYQAKELTTQKESSEKQLLILFNEWRAINKQQRLVADPEKFQKRKQEISAQINALQEQRQNTLELKEQYLKEKEREQTIIQLQREEYIAALKKKEVMIERLQAEHKHQESVLIDLEKRKTAYEHEQQTIVKELSEIKEKLTTKVKQQLTLTEQEKQFEKRKTYYHKWVARANMLRQEQAGLEHKKEWTQESENPSCPLCLQNLSASRKRFLQTKFTKLTISFHHRLTRLSRIIKELKHTLIEQHKTVEASKKEREQYALLESKKQDLEKNEHKLKLSIDDLQKALTEQQTKQKTLASSISTEQEGFAHAQKNYEVELQQNQTYQTQKQRREQLEKKLKDITYNPEQHKKLLNELENLQAQEQTTQELNKEIANQQQRKKEIQQLCTTLKNSKEKNKGLTEQFKAFIDLEKKKQDLANKQEEHHKQFKIQQQQKEALLQEKGRLESEQKKLEHYAKEQKEHEKKINILKEKIDDYQTLATALGKDGVQALLIEDALPEIEQEANELLAQLTNNQAHIIIESLRDLKKGGTKETLDIKISDPMGIRPYELFSGGEAFRIDFALRISISKLLARRAGTSLQTLIIDEGFGSQDEEGLALLMEAIYAIQNNFHKVIIVSHLSAMKDQFPVHFFIQKGPHGSTVNVIQQG